jgi:hypothetical protein
MISKAIVTAYQEKIKRNWDTLYVAIDLHGTIIERYTDEKVVPYKNAVDVLIELSRMSDITLILYTSTYYSCLRNFYILCESFDINFKFLNENPECENTLIADFSKKFYFNVLIDDKAGFDPNNDWIVVLETIKVCKKMEKCNMTECVNGLRNRSNYTICKLCNQYEYFSS